MLAIGSPPTGAVGTLTAKSKARARTRSARQSISATSSFDIQRIFEIAAVIEKPKPSERCLVQYDARYLFCIRAKHVQRFQNGLALRLVPLHQHDRAIGAFDL